MQKFMPIFPLSIVVFPGENLNLHIFEPRYISLIKEIQESKKTFAIPLYVKNNLAEYATEMELISIEKEYADGKLDIKTKGLRTVRILHFMEAVEGKPYHGAIIQTTDNNEPAEKKINPLLIKLLEKLKEAIGIEKPIFKDLENLCSYDIAHYVGFSLDDKYHLLTIEDEKIRQNMIYLHLQKTLPDIRKNVELINRIKMNGHFRNEIPPTII